jgi:hypothetical protein
MRDLAARMAPELCSNHSPNQRAWGTPGARRTRSLACKRVVEHTSVVTRNLFAKRVDRGINKRPIRQTAWFFVMPGHSSLPCSTSEATNARKFRGFGEIMRRRLELFIPIVLLSVLVQLFAPIAAFRVVAYAVTDPLYLASICTEPASSPDVQTAPAKKQHNHGDCCAFCAGGHGGSLADDPPSFIFVSLQRLYQRVSWLEAANAIPAARFGSNSQARAPPQLT